VFIFLTAFHILYLSASHNKPVFTGFSAGVTVRMSVIL
jgi:hypothetical protein